MVEVLLDNARWAPTHKMTQPWFFKVFMGEGLKNLSTWQAETYKAITPEADFKQRKFEKLQNRPMKASAVVAICMKRDPKESVPEIEEVAAVSCAVQNMLLTATAYGLGAYWGTGGLTFKPEMKEYLGLDEQDKCLGFLYIGYPENEWPKGQRRPQEYYTEWVDE